MKVRFNLKNRKDDPALILLVFRLDQKLVYSTGQFCPQKFWDGKSMRAKSSYKFPQHTQLNLLLGKLESVALDAARKDLIDKGVTSKASVKNALDKFLNKSRKNQTNILSSWIIENNQKRFDSGQIKKATYLSNRGIARRVIAYEKSTNKKYSFEDITVDWFYDFIGFMRMPERGYSKNTIHKTISVIKISMGKTQEHGLHNNNQYKLKEFSVSSEEVYNIYLTIGDLKKIINTKMPNERLRNAKALLLIGSFTGLRHNEFSTLVPGNFRTIKGVRVVHDLGKKVDSNVMVPLHPVVETIINDFGGAPPKSISNQKLNEYLKEVGKLAGIDDIIPIRKTSGNKRIESFVPKYKLITTHTGRRSFATNTYLSGMPETEIMAIMDKKDRDNFIKYIKAGMQERAVLSSKSGFFDGI